MNVLGLRCCTQASSSCDEWELLFIVVCGLLIAVVSLVTERELSSHGAHRPRPYTLPEPASLGCPACHTLGCLGNPAVDRRRTQESHPSPVLTCRRHSLWPLCGGFCGSLCNRAGAEEPRERTQSPHRIPFPRGFGDIESSGTLWATLRSGDTGAPRLGSREEGHL